MIVYADTSFLFSLYVPDANSAAATAKIARLKSPLTTTDFGEFEFTNAISQRLFRRQLSAGQHHVVLQTFSKDVEAGIIRVIPVSASAFVQARHLARTQTPLLGTRALDILHVASALALKASAFYTFDLQQSKLAAAAGLRLR